MPVLFNQLSDALRSKNRTTLKRSAFVVVNDDPAANSPPDHLSHGNDVDRSGDGLTTDGLSILRGSPIVGERVLALQTLLGSTAREVQPINERTIKFFKIRLVIELQKNSLKSSSPFELAGWPHLISPIRVDGWHARVAFSCDLIA
jgi:hypothetical protein